MKTVNIVLGAGALMLASSAAAMADNLIAGPIPVRTPGFITCSATNVNPDVSVGAVSEDITLLIEDANDKGVIFVEGGTQHCRLKPTQSCFLTVFTPTQEPSPYVCNIHSQNVEPSTAPIFPAPVRGSICGEFNNTTYCLQALIDNNSSNGWTCGTPTATFEPCMNPP